MAINHALAIVHQKKTGPLYSSVRFKPCFKGYRRHCRQYRHYVSIATAPKAPVLVTESVFYLHENPSPHSDQTPGAVAASSDDRPTLRRLPIVRKAAKSV